jgi:hypothetical protein
LSTLYIIRFGYRHKVYPPVNRYNELLRKLEPAGFRKPRNDSIWEQPEWRDDPTGYEYTFTAGDVCLAMKADGVVQ